MSRRKVTADDVYTMEDSDYRDLMRKDLARARKSYGKQANHGGTVLISVILMVAAAAVILHHFGLIEIPK